MSLRWNLDKAKWMNQVMNLIFKDNTDFPEIRLHTKRKLCSKFLLKSYFKNQKELRENISRVYLNWNSWKKRTKKGEQIKIKRYLPHFHQIYPPSLHPPSYDILNLTSIPLSTATPAFPYWNYWRNKIAKKRYETGVVLVKKGRSYTNRSKFEYFLKMFSRFCRESNEWNNKETKNEIG